MKESQEKIDLVIDAKDGIVGRLASYAAKQALLGKNIAIVNCRQALLAGRKKNIVNEYLHARELGGSSMKGPFFPKSSERIMKRTIRGMLDYTKGRGAAAFKRVMCYNDLPDEFKDSKKVSLIRPLRAKSMKLHDLEKVI